MKKILVPTDFSENALKAALYAAEIARKSGATVCLLHAAERGNEYLYQPFPYHQPVLSNDLAQLTDFAASLTEVYNGIYIEIALRRGIATDAIVEFAHANAFDFIVMGTKGATGFREVLFGSTTANVIAESAIPVLAIPAAYRVEEPDALLLATNHFEKDTLLLNKVVELAKLFSATVHVVVFEELEETPAANHLHHAHQLQQYLDFLKHSVPGVSFKADLVQGTSYEGAIERYCINNDIDIVAMITYPKDFLARLLHQSATQKMTFHAQIPILAIPARDNAAPA